MVGYGLLGYWRSGNLGDEIQSIAARRFLPTVDCVVYRDALNKPLRVDRAAVKLILNGWFTHRPENWPPSAHLDPLITSFHLTDEIHHQNRSRLSAAKVLLGDGNLRYLIDHSPVGTRDLGTLELLQRHGVPSYFSACLTLTLERPLDAVRGDYVCANDVDPEILRAIRSRTRRPVRRATNIDRLTFGFGRRMRKAEKLLRLYAGAACVVTSRLHCALPCIAMGTPVLLIMGKKDDYRFSGLRGFVRHCSREEFLGRGIEFDLDEPGPNGTSHLAHRERLVAACRDFITKPAAAAQAGLARQSGALQAAAVP